MNEENKLFYTPTVEELLIAIIKQEKVFTTEGYELRYTDDLDTVNKLFAFIQMNDKVGNDYRINNELYKLEYNGNQTT